MCYLRKKNINYHNTIITVRCRCVAMKRKNYLILTRKQKKINCFGQKKVRIFHVLFVRKRPEWAFFLGHNFWVFQLAGMRMTYLLHAYIESDFYCRMFVSKSYSFWGSSEIWINYWYFHCCLYILMTYLNMWLHSVLFIRNC